MSISNTDFLEFVKGGKNGLKYYFLIFSGSYQPRCSIRQLVLSISIVDLKNFDGFITSNEKKELGLGPIADQNYEIIFKKTV